MKYFWTFESDQDDAVWTLRMFATGISGILFQYHTGSTPAASVADVRSVKNARCPTSFMYGRRTRPLQSFARGPFALTGVVFKPQGLSTLLNTHMTSFHDRFVELGDFSKQIGEQLLYARVHRQRVALLSEVLQRHVDGSGSEDVLVTESLRLIRKDIRSIRVPRLLKCLNLSERQFERRFVRAIGVSPHQYIRIVRFREAIRLIKRTQFERLSDIAYDLNYVDQSHFIKDIKALSGYTPKRLVQTVRTGIELPCALILGQSGESSEAIADVCAVSCSADPRAPSSPLGIRHAPHRNGRSDLQHCAIQSRSFRAGKIKSYFPNSLDDLAESTDKRHFLDSRTQ